jgi:phage host-nuclease inhibitor protein Gam
MSEVKQEGDFKIKSKPKMKKFNKNSGEVTKVDLSKPTQEVAKVVIPNEEVAKVVLQEPLEEIKPVLEEIAEEIKEVEDEPTMIGETKTKDFEPEEITAETALLPENIEKLVSFMRDTGGNIEDYVRLNADYSTVDETVLLKEYYRKSKPHLNEDEISFLMEDKFSYDEDIDDDRDIRFKKLAIKEEVAQARSFLEQTKSKYYDEIKLRPGVTQKQQKAIDFFDRYNQDQKVAEQQHSDFKSKTNKYFSDDFKGFDFDVSGKKFRYGVQDPGKVAEDQSNINNFVRKFLDDKGNVTDEKGYHKALYMASNADTIINHFYEQGKSDATKQIITSSKNPSLDVRQPAQNSGFINGIKATVISQDGRDSSKLSIKKIKI